MKPYNGHRHGEAEYNRYTTIPSGSVPAGATRPDGGDHFAQMVHVVNSSSSGSSNGNISDGVDPSILATVADLPNSNPLASMIVDANGDQITSFGGNTLIAETGTPAPVADGDPVNLWIDEYGRQVIFGANTSLNALDVNLINDSTISRLPVTTNLSGIEADAIGSAIDVSLYHNITIHTTSSSVTNGGTIKVQHSLDGTNWVDVDINNIKDNITTEITFENKAYVYIRTTLENRVDGKYTTVITAGN